MLIGSSLEAERTNLVFVKSLSLSVQYSLYPPGVPWNLVGIVKIPEHESNGLSVNR